MVKKFLFSKTGTSLLQDEPYQKAIPDRVKAVNEIGQKMGGSNKAILTIRSSKEIMGKAYCNTKK